MQDFISYIINVEKKKSRLINLLNNIINSKNYFGDEIFEDIYRKIEISSDPLTNTDILLIFSIYNGIFGFLNNDLIIDAKEKFLFNYQKNNDIIEIFEKLINIKNPEFKLNQDQLIKIINFILNKDNLSGIQYILLLNCVYKAGLINKEEENEIM